jgi:hypothetical protein
MVVNLKIPASVNVIPLQSKIRNGGSLLFLPAIKPFPDLTGDEFSPEFNVLLG